MKQLLFLIYFFFMSLFHAQTHNNLTVRVTNLNNNKGVVQFGLYNVASKFPKVGKTYKMVRLKTKGSQGVYTFKDLPQGRYALAIYHDENANKNWSSIKEKSIELIKRINYSCCITILF